MPRSPLNRPLQGIIPPMVTPLDSPESLDRLGLEKLIEHLIAGGVDGLFLLGTTGEGPALGCRLRYELVERACSQVAGRVPVLVNVTHTSYSESCALAAHAKTSGADAVVTAPPFYFALSQNDLLRLVHRLSEEVALPLFLYNIPSLTKTRFEVETVMRAAELPNVWGLKDSSGELPYLKSVTDSMRHHPDFTVLVGPEELLFESLKMGAHGGVCGGANLFPAMFASLYQAVRAGNLAIAEELQQRIETIGKLLYGLGEPESSYLRGLKLGMELLGICKSTLAFPCVSADSRHYEQLGTRLKGLCVM